MPHWNAHKHRWSTWSTILGFAVWVVAIFAAISLTYFDQIKLLIFFGIAVLTPLALHLLTPMVGDKKLHTVAIFFQPVVAALCGLSFLLPIGIAAGVLSASWLALTGMLGLLGLTRLRASRSDLAELCITMGLLYAPISGIWLVIHQTWGEFLKFEATIVLLTAAHFCFIGLGALLIAGLTGRRITRARPLYRVAAIGAIASPGIVAVGITLTSFGENVSPVEVVGVVGLAGSILVLSILILFVVRARIENRTARWLITLSAASLFLTMGLALAYSIGRSTNWWGIPIPEMVKWHGWFNTVGFAFLGLLGWRIEISTSEKRKNA